MEKTTVREIKFRAFVDGKMGKSFDVFDPCFLSTGGTFPDGTIFMQFTGLRDKNGKDIYEGDILQTVTDTVRLSKFLILWDESRARFTKKREDGCYFDLESNQTLLEVIGNLYENPTLLNSK